MGVGVGVCLSPRGWEVSLVLYPSTAEDSVSQFVRLTLCLTLDGQVSLIDGKEWLSPLLSPL